MKIKILHLIGFQMVVAISFGTGVAVGLLEGFVTFGVLFFILLSMNLFRNDGSSSRVGVGVVKNCAVSIGVATLAGTLFAIVVTILEPSKSSFSPLVSGLWAFVNVGFYSFAWVVIFGALFFLLLKLTLDKKAKTDC